LDNEPAQRGLLFFRPPDTMRAMSLVIIIVIGWLYVTILVAANEPTVITGIVSFLFYGALPCSLLLYFAGSKIRRQRRRYREMMAEKPKETPDD
jgi:hypothetical protein